MICHTQGCDLPLATPPVANIQIDTATSASVKVTRKKREKLEKNLMSSSSNQLSMSLSEIEAPASSMIGVDKSKLNSNPTLSRNNKNNTKAYSYCDRDNKINYLDDKVPQLSKEYKAPHHHRSLSRINKFLRNIFRIKNVKKDNVSSSQVAASTSDNMRARRFNNEKTHSDLDGDNEDNEEGAGEHAKDDDEVFESVTHLNPTANLPQSQGNSMRFSRLFGSFRNTGKA